MNDYGNPFFHSDSLVTPIYDPKTRKDVANMRPAIIISSSGMVTVGSPSSFYASELAKDPKCLIAISGYQDEESPGRRMLELAEKGGGILPTASGEVNLSCAIEKYSFSAHSDAYQVATELQASQPRRVVLVHGDGGAREAMAKHLSTLGFKDIHLPNLGGQIELPGKRDKRSQVAFTAKSDKNNTESNTDKEASTTDNKELGSGLEETLANEESQPLSPLVTDGNLKAEHLEPLAEKLVERDTTSRAYTITELLASAGYSPNQISVSEIERVKILLKGKNSPFSQDKSSKLVWRLRVLPGNRLATKLATITEADLPKLVKKAFATEEGLYKVGINKPTRSVTVKFHFPKPIVSRHKETLEQLTKETGWLVEISASVHQEELSKAALAVIPKDWQPQNVSIMLDKEIVAVKVLSGDTSLLSDIDKSFQEKTGFKLEVQIPKVVTVSGSNIDAGAIGAKLEINAAYAKIREAFTNQPHQLIKMGLKGEAIELTFITPEIGKRYEKIMGQVSQEIGYSLQARPSPDQIKLQQMVKTLLPNGWSLANEPSVNLAKQEITIKLLAPLVITPKAFSALKEQVFQHTGWLLLLKN